MSGFGRSSTKFLSRLVLTAAAELLLLLLLCCSFVDFVAVVAGTADFTATVDFKRR